MTMEEAIQQLDGAEMMLLNREFIQFNQANLSPPYPAEAGERMYKV